MVKIFFFGERFLVCGKNFRMIVSLVWLWKIENLLKYWRRSDLFFAGNQHHRCLWRAVGGQRWTTLTSILVVVRKPSEDLLRLSLNNIWLFVRYFVPLPTYHPLYPFMTIMEIVSINHCGPSSTMKYYHKLPSGQFWAIEPLMSYLYYFDRIRNFKTNSWIYFE